MSEAQLSSSRPYLIRAINEWLLDNSLTPHLIVDASTLQVSVPQELVKDGRIIFNISPLATSGLCIDNDKVCFEARFSDRQYSVSFPVSAVLAIYARENGRGIMFPEAIEIGVADDAATDNAMEKKALRKSHLRLIK